MGLEKKINLIAVEDELFRNNASYLFASSPYFEKFLTENKYHHGYNIDSCLFFGANKYGDGNHCITEGKNFVSLGPAKKFDEKFKETFKETLSSYLNKFPDVKNYTVIIPKSREKTAVGIIKREIARTKVNYELNFIRPIDIEALLDRKITFKDTKGRLKGEREGIVLEHLPGDESTGPIFVEISGKAGGKEFTHYFQLYRSNVQTIDYVKGKLEMSDCKGDWTPGEKESKLLRKIKRFVK